MDNLSELNIDVESESQEQRSFDAIPNGTYPVIVTASEMKETKAGNGKYLSLTFDIIDGDFKGRKVWENLNVVNPSAVSEKIGRSQLAALCKAVDVDKPTDSNELHDKPLLITVRKDKKEADRNVVAGYSQISDSYEAPEAPKAPPKPAPATGKKPWQK